jgi:hypothetical protein
MSEEELLRSSDQTNFKVEVNGQVQVQVLIIKGLFVIISFLTMEY